MDKEQELRLHGPFKTDDFASYIYGSNDKIGGDNPVLEIRGWGYLTGNGHGALGLSHAEAVAEQKRFASFVVDALNAAWNRRSSDEQAEVVGWPITAEGYVYEFVRRGEKNTRKLAPWEQAYQDADLIEAARRHGYINIAGNVACDVTVTDRGRWIAEIYGRALYASPPSVAKGGVTEALLAALDDAAEDWALECLTAPASIDSFKTKMRAAITAALAVGDEGIREGEK